MTSLTQHDWPGNVRELENAIERALIRSSGETLQLDMPVADKPRAGKPAAAQGTLDEVQRAHIEHVLSQCGWRINGRANAAERLGLHPNTLRFRMKKLGITSRRSPASAAGSFDGSVDDVTALDGVRPGVVDVPITARGEFRPDYEPC
jgi:DNA-binding NtrC family response regulator